MRRAGAGGGLGRELLAVCPFQKLWGRWGHTGVLTGLKLTLRETMKGRPGWQGLPHASVLKLYVILAIPASPAQRKGHFPYRGLTDMCRVFIPAFGELNSQRTSVYPWKPRLNEAYNWQLQVREAASVQPVWYFCLSWFLPFPRCPLQCLVIN